MRKGFHASQWFRTMVSSVDTLFPSLTDVDVDAAAAGGWRIDLPSAYCHRCGATTGPGEATKTGCSHCRVKPAKPSPLGDPVKAVRQVKRIRWDHLLRLCAYREPVSSWIVQMKHGRRWRWASWFGKELAQVIRHAERATRDAQEEISPQLDAQVSLLPSACVAPRKQAVCYVPMPWSRRWKRGFNQARLIANVVAKELELPLARILVRKGWQHPQTNVVPSEREANVRDAFVIEQVDLTGWDIWLIDDVKTSGATLNACCRLLKQAGAQTIRCAVVAVADPKKADFKVV